MVKEVLNRELLLIEEQETFKPVLTKMAETITPVEETPITPDAGQGNGEPTTSTSKELDSQELVELLEAHDKALEKAERKIISMKRKAKELDNPDEEDEEDEEERVRRIVDERLASIQPQSQKDEELEEIAAIRKKNSELLATIRSKKAISNNSVGNNQDHKEPEDDPKKGYSQADLVVLQRVATRRGMSLDDYLKSKK